MGARGKGALKKPKPPAKPVGRPSFKTPPELVDRLWALVPKVLERYEAILDSDLPEAMRHQVNVGAKVLDLLLRAKQEDEAAPKEPEKHVVEFSNAWRSNGTGEA